MASEDFEKELEGYTYVSTLWGETIKQFALRTLGDADLWLDIVNLNGLRHPYISDEAGKHVVKYGDMLMVPSSQSQTEVDEDPDSVFGVDIKLADGQFVIKNGDISRISGIKNFTQSIQNRVKVETKELLYHPDYGCRVREVMGIPNSYSAGMMAVTFVKGAIQSDVRTDVVQECTADISGDSIMIDAKVTPISGRPTQSIAWELS